MCTAELLGRGKTSCLSCSTLRGWASAQRPHGLQRGLSPGHRKLSCSTAKQWKYTSTCGPEVSSRVSFKIQISPLPAEKAPRSMLEGAQESTGPR